ncbi:hypothetical protein EVAR_93981_1 [Eumeta japonica]|uniref:Uncharacterized protein n=1 Tax=Eumeta variegata TaxID=151549 RepID=A0A4C1TPB2_EUMVA|nr:hypothetical protein EVAR_93981_1 [Eumeta japonica]
MKQDKHTFFELKFELKNPSFLANACGAALWCRQKSTVVKCIAFELEDTGFLITGESVEEFFNSNRIVPRAPCRGEYVMPAPDAALASATSAVSSARYVLSQRGLLEHPTPSIRNRKVARGCVL